jgi:hypothetical protein
MTKEQDHSAWAGVKRLPDLWAPLEAGVDVTFDKIVLAWQLSADRLQDRRVRAEARAAEQALRARFIAQESRLVNSAYFRPRSGCALTERRQGGWRGRGITRTLHAVLGGGSPTIVATLLEISEECRRLLRQANAIFGRRASARAQAELTDASLSVYAAITKAAELAATRDDDPQLQARTEVAMSGLEGAKRHVERAVRREVGYAYLTGTLAGGAVAVGLCGLLGLVSSRYWYPVLDTASLVGALAFGSIGAVASVFQRVSADQVLLSFTPAHTWVRVLGMLRPVLGATFGAVAYFALVGGVVGSAAAAMEPTAGFGLAVATGFAGGFTERFAADIVKRVRPGDASDGEPSGRNRAQE